MGSLTLAVAGGLQGAGEGIAYASKDQMEQNRQAALLRLQNQYASERQATGIQAQKDIESQRETYETGAKSKEYDVMAKSAGAHAQLMTTLKQLEIEGRHKDIADLISGRITVQDLKNQGQADVQGLRNQKPPTGKEFTPTKMTLNSPGKDPYDGSPIPGKPVNVLLHRDGSAWMPVGDKLFRFDPSQPNGYAQPPSSVSRPTPDDVKTLMQNPLLKLPSGISARDYFESKYHYLPASYLNAAESERARINAAQPGQAGQPGSRAAAPQGSASTPAPAPADPDDAEDDNQDMRIASGGDPYGNTGPPTPQASDDEPAQ
jgi:hypothetical protein